eukprot:987882-Pyramimonas_sp.AAC.1
MAAVTQHGIPWTRTEGHGNRRDQGWGPHDHAERCADRARSLNRSRWTNYGSIWNGDGRARGSTWAS